MRQESIDVSFDKMPKDWRLVVLGEIGVTYNGLTGKSKEDFGTGEPFIPYMNIFSNNSINPTWLEYVTISANENQNQVKYGDIFFTTSSETPKEVGMSSVLLKDIGVAYLNSFCFGFRLNDFNTLIPEYAKFLFRGKEVRKSIIVFAQGSTRFNLSKTTLLKRLTLLLPPLPEQQKIADILTTVDDKLENIESQIAEYTNLKTGLMQQLLTKGIGHSKFVDSKLGMIPEGWRVVKLGEIGSTYNGLSGKSKDDFGNGEPYIPYMNIFSNNTINPNWLEYVSISPDENQNAVKYGDVFFTTSSETPEEVGMSSVLLDDIGTAYLNSFCFGFRLNDFNALLPDYAKFLFRGQAVRKSIVVFAQGSTRFNLSKTNILKRLHLALPPISEQKEIANILTSVDEKMKSLLQKKEEYTKLKKGLMEQLLTGRIRVKV